MGKTSAICIIPARLNSTRLPRKLLLTLGTKPVIQHVYEHASRAQQLNRVLVACDHKAIAQCVTAFGGKAVLTREDHVSGTSRLSEVAQDIDEDIVVNVQGDEPFISPTAIDCLVECLQHAPDYEMATLYSPIRDANEEANPNIVKVVVSQSGRALYFSRSAIPYHRDKNGVGYKKHLGIYAYRRSLLLRYHTLAPSPLEETEKLEQLRMLENSIPIKAIETDYDSLSIDTQADLDRARAMVAAASEVVH